VPGWITIKKTTTTINCDYQKGGYPLLIREKRKNGGNCWGKRYENQKVVRKACL